MDMYFLYHGIDAGDVNFAAFVSSGGDEDSIRGYMASNKIKCRVVVSRDIHMQ